MSGLSLKASFNDIKRSHWKKAVSMDGANTQKNILVSAVRVEPVAAATSFAWKGSIERWESQCSHSAESLRHLLSYQIVRSCVGA